MNMLAAMILGGLLGGLVGYLIASFVSAWRHWRRYQAKLRARGDLW